MNDIRLDRKGLHGDISWLSIGMFIAREWRVVALAIALLFHTVWIHTGQTRQDKSITALQKDDAEFKRAVANCIVLEQSDQHGDQHGQPK